MLSNPLTHPYQQRAQIHARVAAVLKMVHQPNNYVVVGFPTVVPAIDGLVNLQKTPAWNKMDNKCSNYKVAVSKLRPFIVLLQMAVEKVQGISRLEQLCEELSEEERAKELKQEKKRQKRKNRRKNKCVFDMSEQETKGYEEKSLGEVRAWLSLLEFLFLCCPFTFTFTVTASMCRDWQGSWAREDTTSHKIFLFPSPGFRGFSEHWLQVMWQQGGVWRRCGVYRSNRGLLLQLSCHHHIGLTQKQKWYNIIHFS